MKKYSLFILLLLAAVLLTACGNANYNETPATDTPTETAAPETPVATSAGDAAAVAADTVNPADTGDTAYGNTAETPEPTKVPAAAATPAPAATPVPTATPTPAPAPAVLTVTKSPTDENTIVGGNACFIAHADNAVSREWSFVSPDGQSTCNRGGFEDRFGNGTILGATDDTMYIKGVSAGMEGWKVYCTFTDASGKTARSNAATVHVLNNTDVYKTVLDAYTELSRNGRDGVSEKSAFYDDVAFFDYDVHSIGYYFKDMNGDGVAELMFCCTDQSSDNTVYAMYALQNGNPVTVFVGHPRDRYYVMNTGLLYNAGSCSAFESVFNTYSVTGSKLQQKTGLLYKDGVCYSVTGDTRTEITTEAFDSAISQIEAMVVSQTDITAIH